MFITSGVEAGTMIIVSIVFAVPIVCDPLENNSVAAFNVSIIGNTSVLSLDADRVIQCYDAHLLAPTTGGRLQTVRCVPDMDNQTHAIWTTPRVCGKPMDEILRGAHTVYKTKY